MFWSWAPGRRAPPRHSTSLRCIACCWSSGIRRSRSHRRVVAASRALPAVGNGAVGRLRRSSHDPCHATRAIWGSRAPTETDFLRDPEGPGWHLDRARFDAWLRREAVARGAALVRPAGCARSPATGTAGGSPSIPPTARSSGAYAHCRRERPLVGDRRGLGARRVADDRLVCGWVHGRDGSEPGRGVTHVVAEPDGWWYAAPQPGNRRVLAFFTDADLPAARDARDPDALLARAARSAHVAEAIPTIRFTACPAHGFTAGHGAMLTPPAGDDWAAAGDAALAFDPLSAQGLLNSLFTGLAAAHALARTIAGDLTGLTEYTATLTGIRDAYRRHLTSCYADERRWPERPFWQRRHAPGSAPRRASSHGRGADRNRKSIPPPDQRATSWKRDEIRSRAASPLRPIHNRAGLISSQDRAPARAPSHVRWNTDLQASVPKPKNLRILDLNAPSAR